MRVQEQECRQVLSQLDAYVDHSLTPQAVQALEGHLERCADCQRELESRQRVRARLKSAVHNIDTPAHLETRIRAHVLETGDSHRFRTRLIAVTAAALVCAGIAVAYQMGHLRFTRNSRESYIGSVNSKIPALMRVGLGDHIHCSVFRKYPVSPPTVEQMSAALGPQYGGLIPIVKQYVPAGFRLVLAHQCRYHERKFIHLALKNDSRLLSLVITRKIDGESFSKDELLPALSESGISIYRAGVQRFQIAALESSAYIVYVISDLPQPQNMELMRAIAPALRNYLGKLES
jgi:anti-sigma factor (TIGR02949 family)